MPPDPISVRLRYTILRALVGFDEDGDPRGILAIEGNIAVAGGKFERHRFDYAPTSPWPTWRWVAWDEIPDLHVR